MRQSRTHVATIWQALRRFTAFLAAFLAASVVVTAALGVAPALAEPQPVNVPGSWALIFGEEFNSAGLNKSVWTAGWQHEGISGPMSEQCISSSLASQPGDGYLHLKVTSEHHGCEWEHEYSFQENTGSLTESNPGDGVPGHSGFSYTYGYVEWRAYVNGSAGGALSDWPGLWSEPAYQGSSHETETDTMEGLAGKACFHVHNFLIKEETGGCPNGGYAGAWHTYGVDWEANGIVFYYDGKYVGQEFNNTVKPQYLIMDDVPPDPFRNQPVNGEMKVDYVRVWQHATAPSATTGSATGISETGATLNGTVSPNGRDTHYYFQYGTSTSYGSTTGEVDVGSGMSAVGASTAIAGLAPSTTYHYRLVAHNELGTTYGGDVAFATASRVPELGLVGINKTKSEQVQVHWDALKEGKYVRAGDALSDFEGPENSNWEYRWQLFGSANGAPELGVIERSKTEPTEPISVYWDVLKEGKYVRAGDYLSDFESSENSNWEYDWQLFGSGTPELGVIERSKTEPTQPVEVHWDALKEGKYVRAGDYLSDFESSENSNWEYDWQLFGSGTPELGVIERSKTEPTQPVEVHWDALTEGKYGRIGDYLSDFESSENSNWEYDWHLFGSSTPELGVTERSNTEPTQPVEVHWDALTEGKYGRIGDYLSDFESSENTSYNYNWQLF
jgi:hypothetical protein